MGLYPRARGTGTGGTSKNKEENFLRKLPGNTHNKFRHNPLKIKKYGILFFFSFLGGGTRGGWFRKTKKSVFLGRCQVTYMPILTTIHQYLRNMDFFWGGGFSPWGGRQEDFEKPKKKNPGESSKEHLYQISLRSNNI